jgi:hypothetical protein
MYERVRDGIPSVTEPEYIELDNWYLRNQTAIRNGRDIDVLRGCCAGKGPRRLFATKYIERVRQLRRERPDLE